MHQSSRQLRTVSAQPDRPKRVLDATVVLVATVAAAASSQSSGAAGSEQSVSKRGKEYNIATWRDLLSIIFPKKKSVQTHTSKSRTMTQTN